MEKYQPWCGQGGLQIVPEWKGEVAERKADKDSRELSHENVLRNLAHGRETVVTGGRKVGEVRKGDSGHFPCCD